MLVELDEQRGQPTADEGLRLISNLVADDFKAEKRRMSPSASVEVTFLDVSPEFSLPLFKLSQEPRRGRCGSLSNRGTQSRQRGSRVWTTGMMTIVSTRMSALHGMRIASTR